VQVRRLSQDPEGRPQGLEVISTAIRSRFSVHRPGSLEEALGILAERGASVRVVAGATDVSVQMRAGTLEEDELMDISGLRDLRYVREVAGGLDVGALATLSDIAGSPAVRASAPVLADAARSFGSPQIRNLATLAGNVCNASPAGDGIPPLHVLGAAVRLTGVAGTREVPIGEFATGVHRTARKPDELVTSIRIGRQPPGSAWFFRKLGLRAANAISIVSAAGVIRMEGRAVKDASIALGAVAPTVIRARRAEEVLMGRELTEEVMWDAAEAAAAESRPISDVRGSAAYRRMAVAGILYRALEEVAGG